MAKMVEVTDFDISIYISLSFHQEIYNKLMSMALTFINLPLYRNSKIASI